MVLEYTAAFLFRCLFYNTIKLSCCIQDIPSNPLMLATTTVYDDAVTSHLLCLYEISIRTFDLAALIPKTSCSSDARRHARNVLFVSDRLPIYCNHARALSSCLWVSDGYSLPLDPLQYVLYD